MNTRPDRPSRQQTGAISTILTGLRRRVRRGSRDVIETAVSQLFDAVVGHPRGAAASGEYRIDDLARLAGTTTRSGGCSSPLSRYTRMLRVGRLALFNDTHLTRLRLITSMLNRGYNIAHVREMITAWEQGKDLGDVLGLETAIAGTWAAEKPQTMAIAEAKRLISDEHAFDRLVGSGLIRIEQDGQDATVVRPKLIEAFNDVRQYGITIDKLIDIHERVLPLVNQISSVLVQAGAEHVQDHIKPGVALPDDTEVAELITMLVQFRTQAVAAVTATLASSIETTIEGLVSRILADYVEKAPDADG
jgi:DNA-binding transcriptional MerR regulator